MLRKILAPINQRPVVVVNPRYEWVWLIAFVEPLTGRNIWYIMPYLNTVIFQIVLDLFAAELKIDDETKVLLVLDRAAWHMTMKLRIPKGIEIIPLPPYSPEIQPAEHLWALADEVLYNQNFESLAALEDAFCERCGYLQVNQELVKSTTCFEWWLDATKAIN